MAESQHLRQPASRPSAAHGFAPSPMHSTRSVTTPEVEEANDAASASSASADKKRQASASIAPLVRKFVPAPLAGFFAG